jgi:drug/metabolite transporter (DMT)-like permease
MPNTNGARIAGPMGPPMAMMTLLLAALCWGAGNVANKTVLDTIGPMTAAAGRAVIATVVIAPFALHEVKASRGWCASAVVVSLFFATGLALQQVAFQTTTVTNAGFLVNTCSIMTPLFAWLLLGERAPRRIVYAAGVTLIGAFLMTGAGFSLAAMNRGDLICLASAAFYSAWMVLLGQHLRRFGGPYTICAAQFAVAACGLAPMAFGVERPTTIQLIHALPELLFLGVVSTGFAFLLQTRAQQHVSSSIAGVIVSAESLFGAVMAYLWLGERTPLSGLIGGALILAGIIAAAVTLTRPAQIPNPTFRTVRLRV